MENALTKDDFRAALAKRHGKETQGKLEKSTVAVCGLGGLGSNIAISLARAGVGRLILIDFDRVDISNLNRQQYAVSQLGMYKTEALTNTLKAITPLTEIITHTVRLDEKNVRALLSPADVICEAFDRSDQKAMLVNASLELFPQKPIVSGSGMAGLASANDIKTKKLAGKLYICGDAVSDSENGLSLFAPRVMLCAAHQALMTIKILLNDFEP